MSRKNKVNPDHYKGAGRLTPDDLARERTKQRLAKTVKDWGERTKQSSATGRGAEPSDDPETAMPSPPAAAHRSAKGSAKMRAKKLAAGTKKKSRPTRFPVPKPGRTAAAGKKSLGRKSWRSSTGRSR